MRNLLRRLLAADAPQGRAAPRVYREGERDALTGVADRDAFWRIVEEALAGGRRSGCLVLVDVDSMQEIHERFGKERGNQVLRAVADLLRENFRGSDGIGRLEEDGFAVWVEDLPAEHIGAIRRRIAVINDKLLHRGEGLPAVTLSAGAALGEPGDKPKELHSQALRVLQRVKEGGRCGCEVSG